ncbi:DUF3883 domain-containing protein [Vagococcus sp. BWB3-3]|uniref:DUF3883 domain-containing protein n=1 Tax=Vagococcus allomyrinae TaxID=2794353 RepID=A0A940SVY5_9ENTE|nr:DUF3883 domain-containing protein [Vagococcus allomyrinae]MBP1042389.1 DUF3883 domain-containing protein [Vagococcus allomyrinae]
MINFPKLKFTINATKKQSEFEKISFKTKAEVVYSHLFEGLSTRKNELKNGLNDSDGWAAWNILQHYGIQNEHKKSFSGCDLPTVINYLNKRSSKGDKSLVDLLSFLNNDFKDQGTKEDTGQRNIIKIDSDFKYNIEDFNLAMKKNLKSFIIEEDFQRLNEIKKKNGTKGEEFVVAYYHSEIKSQISSSEKREYLLRGVEYVGDKHGLGYDVIGWDLNTIDSDNPQKIFIEVKSTTSQNIHEPFYISKNELDVGLSMGESYRIGRIIDVNGDKIKYFEITPFKTKAEQRDFKTVIEDIFINEPMVYKVYGLKQS